MSCSFEIYNFANYSSNFKLKDGNKWSGVDKMGDDEMSEYSEMRAKAFKTS